MIFDEIAQTADLFDPIFVRNGDQNRLVKSAAHDFHLAARRERGDLLNIFGMLLGQPFEQRAGIMQPQADARVPRHALHKRQIGMLIGAFHHLVKIADGLVRVNEQN